MTPRKYDLGKRAESVEETKRRILDATFALHNEQGVAATTLADVAKRADVALGTVYKHFPTVDHLVMGCSALVVAQIRSPGSEIFAGRVTTQERLRALTEALFAAYERGARPIEGARCEQGKVAPLRAFVEQDALDRRELAREALRPLRATARTTNEIVALTDFYVWKAMHDNGVPTQRAAAIIAGALLAHTEGAPARKRQPT